MKANRKSAHTPGAQGHDPTLLSNIEKLTSAHGRMMGNLTADSEPQDTSGDDRPDKNGMESVSRLYEQQAPRDFRNTKKYGRTKPRRTRDYGGGAREDNQG